MYSVNSQFFFMGYRYRLIILSVCLLVTNVSAQNTAEDTFTNPIIAHGQDPWVVAHEGMFYYCYSTGRGINVRVSARLESIGQGDKSVLWTAPALGAYSQNVWAPEMHRIGERWYVYFAADDGENKNHRMYVLRSEGDDPDGPYVFVGKVADKSDRWAIDGTVYQDDTGALYFIWSGPPESVPPDDEAGQQNLYLAAMSDPVTVEGERVLISSPEFDWERVGDPDVNEGPTVLKRGERVHVIYSASGSWTDDYCLGRLTLEGDDPLAAGAWVKHDEPVFAKTGGVFGPGHASFVRVGDGAGGVDWIVYHAARSKGSGWDRDVRLQPFGWDGEGNPDFGEPVEVGVRIGVPNGPGMGQD